MMQTGVGRRCRFDYLFLISNLTHLEHDMVFAERRAAWIQDALELVQDQFADGIVFDYESPQRAGSLAGHAYAKLIAETRQVFQSVNPSYQISTCVPWSPDKDDGDEVVIDDDDEGEYEFEGG